MVSEGRDWKAGAARARVKYGAMARHEWLRQRAIKERDMKRSKVVEARDDETKSWIIQSARNEEMRRVRQDLGRCYAEIRSINYRLQPEGQAAGHGHAQQTTGEAKATPYQTETIPNPQPESIHSLCQQCSNLLYKEENVQSLTSNNLIEFRRIWGDIETGCTTGCQFCVLIAYQFKSAAIDDVGYYVELIEAKARTCGQIVAVKLMKGQGGPDKSLSDLEELVVECCEAGKEHRHMSHQQERMIVSTSEVDPAAKFIKRRPRNYDIGDSRSYQMAKQWIENCSSFHLHCSIIERSAALPTRVINVGSSSSNQQNLFLTQRASGAYIALSYCWGRKAQPLVTSISNVESLCLDIPSSSLPQTIKDAIALTRKLCFKYLWVDSLCIIQDSDTDKACEINNMGKIYESAAVTIIAASAKDCHDGFLSTKSYPLGAKNWKPFQLPLRCPDGNLGTITLEPENPYFKDDQPLNHRAWAFQEYLLSPRRLIYSTMQLMWHCRSSEMTSENRPTNLYHSLSDTAIDLSPALATFRLYDPSSERSQIQSLREAHSNWDRIVIEYTARQLTNKQDKLPAISGIAAKYARFLHEHGSDEHYKAGLWYSPCNPTYFVQQLLWHVVSVSQLINTPEVEDMMGSGVFAAPSWSWAGQLKAVLWDWNLVVEDEVLCEIEECVVQLATKALFGRVDSGVLKIRARVRKLCYDDNLEHLVRLLERRQSEDSRDADARAKVYLDDTVRVLQERISGCRLWCVQLTVHGGLVIIPKGEGLWTRIGTFLSDYEEPRLRSNGRRYFYDWFEENEIETITII